MKKIVFLLLFVFLGTGMLTPVWGAYQYNDYVQLNRDGLSVSQNANLTLNFQSTITDWSAITVVATNAVGEVTRQTYAITGNQVNIGNVRQGDQIKFVLTNAQGVSTQDSIRFWGSGWDTNPLYNTYEYLHFGVNYGAYGSGYTMQKFQVSGAAPTGQPLPGILATLALGAGGLVWRKRQRKQR